MENTLEATLVINPIEYGIEKSKANELIGNLPQIQAERAILEDQYSEVITLDIKDPATAKRARDLRLLIRDNRTKGINIWHSTTKEFFLKGGQFVDAIKRKEIAVNERMEANLETIEKHFENLEKERKDKLNADRVSQLEPYNAFVPMGLNFGDISEEEFAKILNGARLQYEQEQAEEAKAEAERKRIEESRKLHNERKDLLIPVWQFLDDNTIHFGELSREEFESIKLAATSKQTAHELEQEKIRKENDRLAKEKEESDKKAAKERAEQDKKLQAEKDAKAKLEAELQAKKDAEAKAEKERIAEEEKQKKEAAKLAKAPIKKQLNAWVNSFEIPTTAIENDKTELIQAKFEAFKRWSLAEIELM